MRLYFWQIQRARSRDRADRIIDSNLGFGGGDAAKQAVKDLTGSHEHD
ncbi:MAG: hypothetical protein U1E83_01065 [Methylotetracoccus sp.]